ncbi:adhesion G-protein coupled receptor G5 [Misgurnus anguillicaudatus]|uniref:adhesion G-protein coupled receptor G5 n=1 Tax=Misgurnus anguillicaudatus TaxID=75329 RepID=UPI003CCF1179
MKKNQIAARIFVFICLLFILCQASIDNDRDFIMCGTWRHDKGSPKYLRYDLRTGCRNIEISGTKDALSIQGAITAKCNQSKLLDLDLNPLQNQSHFCVFWDPLHDLLMVEVNGKIYTLCSQSGLQEACCTDLSPDNQTLGKLYGIVNGNLRGDILSHNVMEVYTFRGGSINCTKTFCGEAFQKHYGPNKIEKKLDGPVDLPCVQGAIIEMQEGFMGQDVTPTAQRNNQSNPAPSIYLPPYLMSAGRKKSKVLITYFRDNAVKTLFKTNLPNSNILEDVVGITVENEIIKNLPEPVRIRFHHSPFLPTQSKSCVSWDNKRDNEVIWRSDGCEIVNINAVETECHCNHLTYFAILVQLKPDAEVRHLEALTFITAVGCAVSLVSCLVLFYWLCKKSTGKKNQSSLVHRGLVVAVFLLSLLFIFTGTLANVGNSAVCWITGALLHYALLSTLCWMAMEVFHAFLLVHQVFKLPPHSWWFYLGGFGLPALLVSILLFIGDIYGKREIMAYANDTNPYYMCWMLNNEKSIVAHYIINLGLLIVVMSSGLVMLLYVVRKILKMPVLKNRYGIFLSIWGLTCLFGLTWVLSFLNFGPFSEAILFLFCIINSLQGFFLMLRHFIMKRIEKSPESSSSSSGFSKQPMLQTNEKS